MTAGAFTGFSASEFASMPAMRAVMKIATYDLEATGTSPAFDQPLQFAAILSAGM